MKKKLIICAILCVLLTGCGNKVPKLKGGEEAILELGNGNKISANEVWDEVKTTYGLSTILNKMDLQIYEEEYKDQKEDVEEYMKSLETSLKANYVDENGFFDENALNEALANAGYTDLSVYLKEQKLAYYQNLAATDYAKTLITEKEVKKYYKDEVVGDIHTLHILVKPASTSTTDLTAAEKKAKDIIEAIKKDIKSGTKAQAAFEKYKDDKSVTFEDLGYFNKGEMEEAFETAAYKLKKGAYSKTPVKTSYGYHVIYKVDEKDKEDLKDVEEEIKETLANELLLEDNKVSIRGILELRKKHGVEFHDSELETAYNKYMNYLLNTDK